MPATIDKPFKLIKTAMGHYYRSDAPRAELEQLLKRAALGGEPDTDFEQAFASLAYSFIKDKAPRLMDFVIGFQLVERDEDKTKAMGVFGFRVGKAWYMAPIFFLSANIRGHELLYIKDKRTFVPLKENWVNYLISKQPAQLGNPTEKTPAQIGSLFPNLMRMVAPPRSVKWGSEVEVMPDIQEWAVPFMPFLALAKTDPARLYDNTKRADTFSAFDLRKWLITLPMLKGAYDLTRQYPLLKSGFDRFYGPNFFLEQAQTIKQGSSFLLPPADFRKKLNADKGKRPGSLLGSKPATEPVKAASDLEIFVYDGHTVRSDRPRSRSLLKGAADNKVDNDLVHTENFPELSDEERMKLQHNMVLIKDKRDPVTTSMVFDAEVPMAISNPHETGIYKVLERPGQFSEMLVLYNPFAKDSTHNFCVVIRKGDPAAWLNIHHSRIWVKEGVGNAPEKADLAAYVKGLSRPDKLQKGATYLAINEAGNCTCPFEVEQVYGDDDTYDIHWLSHCRYDYVGPPSPEGYATSSEYRSDWDRGCCDYKVHLNQKGSGRLRSFHGELSIPEGYKILKLKDPPSPKERSLLGEPECCDEGSKPSIPIQPGDLQDAQMLLREKCAEFKIHDLGGNEVYLSTKAGAKRMSKLAALIHTVKDHRITEAAARAMFKVAAAKGLHREAAVFRVKYAAPTTSDLQNIPFSPPFYEPEYGSEQVGYDSYPSIYPQEQHIPVEPLSAWMTNPQIYDPFYKPDTQTQMIAQQASASGDKELFDVTVFKTLLKSVRAGGMFSDSSGDLMRALNRLGTDYFLLLWHHEEAEDRYGKHDLPDLVDSVRNTFDSLGDVLLFIKEKEVGDADDLGAAVGESSEPSIDEASRD